jgi:hypothetical protein
MLKEQVLRYSRFPVAAHYFTMCSMALYLTIDNLSMFVSFAD